MQRYRTPVRIILIIIIASTLAFIFYQSMLSREASGAESNKVGEIIAEIIPPGTPAGDYVQLNIRKIAHFTEFFVLGCEVALYFWLYSRRRFDVLLVYPAALIVALFDETIQVFSDRGPLITDVWVDFLGFLSSYTPLIVIPIAVINAISLIKRRKEK